MKAEILMINQTRQKHLLTKKWKRMLLLLGLIALFLPAIAQASSLQLKNMVLDNQAGSIMARFGIELRADTQVEDALQSGIKLRLVCDAALFEHKNVWMDSKVAGKKCSNKIYFDSLSNEYVLEKPGDKITKDKSLSILLREEWKSFVLDLGPWSTLQRGERYNLRLKVRLDRTEVPQWLKSTLFFWSWDIVPAATYQLDFTY